MVKRLFKVSSHDARGTCHKRKAGVNRQPGKTKSGNDFLIYRLFSMLLFFLLAAKCYATDLKDLGLYVLPYPQEVSIKGEPFVFKNNLNIVLNKNHTPADEFAANELVRDLKEQWNITAHISNQKGPYTIFLVRKKGNSKIGKQGYEINANAKEIVITAAGEEGLFYGTRTLLQLVQKKDDFFQVPGLKITDWPAILQRAIHYDTKHHQDKMSYVKSFIKELADYKINMLVWEWEDKFAYPSHPEIGAPGAFTPAEIRDVTAFAKKYHIQIVPLVQGLGHASFILKWPQFAHLREIPASNFEFCPLKEGSYDLLFDLWKDAIDATPGSEYIHIGSDETYELGLCDQCKKKAMEISKKGIYHLFTDKAAKYILSKKRKPMVWEMPMGWEMNNSGMAVQPNKGLVLTEDDTRRAIMIDNARRAKQLGYEVFFYDPNPGIEPLFLPYFYRDETDTDNIGCLEESYNVLKKAATSGVYHGMIRTSWDDAGLHNQMWMLSFITSAAFSWNGNSPGLNDFKESYFKNYYGAQSLDMEELFNLLNEGGYYYWDTFERKVWHWGEIGKTFMPDLPRGDAIEYDPYWNTLHKDIIKKSGLELQKINRALDIIQANKSAGAKHPYDFELFETIARLIQHTCMAYGDLSSAEHAIKEANRLTFIDRDSAYIYLKDAAEVVANCINRRSKVFNDLINVWKKTRLPKGMSVDGRKFFFQQDRTRHFANRRPDMTYLIYDEQKLDMEGWLQKLRDYIEKYKMNSFQD